MGRNRLRSGYSVLCPELARILKMELASGNVLSESPRRTDWPAAGSVFASLVHDFKTKKTERPDAVEYSICNSSRDGWFEEYFCTLHKHLLVAGSPRLDAPAGSSKESLSE